MTKHTPGPWYPASPDHPLWIVIGDGRTVANVCPHDLSASAVAANARLIKAAPDLHKAAAHALEALNNVADWIDDPETDVVDNAIAVLRAALEKVEA